MSIWDRSVKKQSHRIPVALGVTGTSTYVNTHGPACQKNLFYYKWIKKRKLLRLPHVPEYIRKNHYFSRKLLHRVKESHLALFLIKLRKVTTTATANPRTESRGASCRASWQAGKSRFRVWLLGGSQGPRGPRGGRLATAAPEKPSLAGWLAVTFVPLVLSLQPAQVSFRGPWFWGPGFRNKQTNEDAIGFNTK